MDISPTLKQLPEKFQLFIFRYRLFGYVLLSVSIFWVFYPAISKTSLFESIQSLFIVTASSLYTELVFGTIFFVNLSLFIWHLIRRKKFNPTFLHEGLFPFVTLLFYLPLRFNWAHDSWYYESFKLIPFLTYADMLMLFFMLVTYRPQLKSPQTVNPSNPFSEDDLHRITGKDLLNRNDYAIHLAQLISNQNARKSFAIAINGPWGSGKSVFLEQVSNGLKGFVLLHFNPWLSKQANQIPEDFLQLIVETVRPYNSSLSKQLQSYGQALLKIDEAFSLNIGKVFGYLSSTQEDSLNQQRKHIRDTIDVAKIKVAIFIDDLDRLTGPEIAATMSLIRNSFEFPNFFFVVAFDKQYVIELLTKEKVENAGQYLDKIFQLDIDLPSYPATLLTDQFIQLLSEEKSDLEKSNIRNCVARLEKQFDMLLLLQNLRQCVRFANSFNHVYDKKIREVDLYDFMLLELLKLRYKDVYGELRAVLIGERTSQVFQAYVTDGVLKITTSKSIQNKYKHDSGIIEEMFESSHYNPIRGVRVPGNALRYFSDQLFGNISFSDLDLYHTADQPAFIQFVDQSIADEKQAALLELLPKINYFPTTASLTNYVKGTLHFCSAINDDGMITVLTQTICNQISETGLFRERSSRDDFFDSIFLPDNYSWVEFKLAGELIRRREQNPEETFINADRLFLQMANILDDYVIHQTNHKKPYNYEWYRLFEQLPASYYEKTGRSLSVLQEYIRTNFKAFITQLPIIRQRDGIYRIDASLNEYLGWSLLESWLNDIEEDLSILLFKSFFYQFKTNNYQPVQLDREKLLIVSDPLTRFTTSNHPEYSAGPSIVKNRATLDTTSHHFPPIRASKWIGHAEPISDFEALNGGEYHFARIFNIPVDFQIRSARLDFFVDDFLSVSINNDLVCSKKQTPAYNSLYSIDLTGRIISGTNQLNFILENIKGEPQWKSEDNPCEFIYALQINVNKLPFEKYLTIVRSKFLYPNDELDS